MRISYDQEVDTLVIKLVEDVGEFRDRFSHDNELMGRDVHAAIATDGAIMSIDIENASRKYPLEMLNQYPATYDDPIPLAIAAENSGLAIQTLKQAILRGRLTGKKIGRNWTTTLADLHEYLSTRKHAGPGSKRATA